MSSPIFLQLSNFAITWLRIQDLRVRIHHALFIDAMNLLDLPPEILRCIPQYLSCVQDHYSLMRACRATYRNCFSVNAPLPLMSHHGPLPPMRTRLLLAGVARQIADWAVQEPSGRSELETCLEQGNDALLELACKVVRVTLEHIRELHDDFEHVVEPIAAQIEDEWAVRLREAYPDESIDRTALQAAGAVLDYWTYCELFHHDIDSKGSQWWSTQAFSALRNWISYCTTIDDIIELKLRPGLENPLLDPLEMMLDSQLWHKTHLELKSLWSDAAPKENIRVEMFWEIGHCLGKDYLKLMLPGGATKSKGKLEELKVDIWEQDLATDFDVPRPWTILKTRVWSCSNLPGWRPNGNFDRRPYI